jgi:hypothetical protein
VGWTFFYLMIVLKLPIAALLYIVWRAINDVDDPLEATPEGEDGGSKTPGTPRDGRPRPRPRGPHGEPPLPAPPRTRTPAVSRPRTPH